MRRFGMCRIWTVRPRRARESPCTLAGEGTWTQACLARAVRGLCCELNVADLRPTPRAALLSRQMSQCDCNIGRNRRRRAA